MSSQDQGQAPAAQGPPQEGAGQQQPRPSWWQIVRSVLFQVMIIYFISSFFRGRQQPQQTPDGSPPTVGYNLYPKGQEMVGSGVC